MARMDTHRPPSLPPPRAAPAAPLHGLTALRFLAALWVVVHHFWPRVQGVHADHGPLLLLDRLAASGFVGVTIFFVLSGYLLARTYPRLRASQAPGFYRARLARIYPMYLLALACALPQLGHELEQLRMLHGALAGSVLGGLKGLSVLLLVQAWWPSAAQFWNGPAWSLSAEACFYLLFPALSRRLDRPGRWGLGAAILSLGLGLGLWGVHAAAPGFDSYALIGMCPLLRLPEFVLGMALGVAGRAGGAAWAWGGAAWLLLLAGSAVPPELLGALALPGAAALIHGLARAEARVPGALIPLGEGSYALYLLQVPLAALLLPGASSPLGFLGYLAVLVSVSLLVHQAFERPLRRRWRGAAISKV